MKGGEGFIGAGMPENDIFYFHPDYLGSTSYITTKSASINEHVELSRLKKCFLKNIVLRLVHLIYLIGGSWVVRLI